LAGARSLAKELKFSWSVKTKKGFFMRAEDVFGFTNGVKDLMQELSNQADKYIGDDYGSRIARGSILGQKKSLEKRYGADLDANSHGETFLRLFKSRFVPGGIYLLDEPETALSFTRQLSFLIMLREMVKQDSQFIIITHSPIISALPEASIYSLDSVVIQKVKYKDIEQFNLMRDFLSNPEMFLKYL
jgi:predicted ATPase